MIKYLRRFEASLRYSQCQPPDQLIVLNVATLIPLLPLLALILINFKARFILRPYPI